MTTWDDVVREHGPSAYRSAWRILGHAHDTEDVLQDTFLEAHRSFLSGSVRNWRAFLNQLVTYRSLDRLRQRKPSLELDELLTVDCHASPDDEAVARETEARIRACVAELPERQAAVFCLFHFEALSHEDIAETLNITTNAVAVALYKSREALRGQVLESAQEEKS